MEEKEFENSTSAEASNSESKKTEGEEGANKNTFKLKNAKGALIFD